jgi:predicted metal-dependent hydrolase
VSAAAGTLPHLMAPQMFEVNAIADVQQEIFGPVLQVVRWGGDPMAVIEQINALGYGLTLGIQTRIDSRAQALAAAARQAFEAFYAQKGLERLQRRVAHFAPRVGVVPGTVQVRGLGFRWAACQPNGDMYFHWKCLMAPLTVLDYIVVHELCHLHHRDHSDAFWNEVDKVLPDHRERKEWLRVRGAALDL